MRITVLFFFSILVGCDNKDSNCSFSYVHLDKKVYNIKGCLVDSLEEGKWQIFDSSNNLLEWGNYEHGIRTGDWHYSQMSDDSIISWKKYQNDSLAMATNIPIFLDSLQEGSFFAKFSQVRESRVFNIVIAIHDIERSNLDVDSFYLLGEREIAAKEWKYQLQRQEIETNEGKYYFNLYNIDSSAKGPFEILNVYKLFDGKLVEITCSFDSINSRRARTIFVSVLSNLFLNSKRFANPFENIKNDK
jgi:hypothetical protein